MAKNMVEIVGVTKRFGSSVAVHEVNLEIRAGEFLTLLGPSGCGKTTLLRMISGFETPSSGRILLDGQDVTHAPPYKRDVNQVFQSYALFPHLNVRDNIAFGLKMRRIAKAEMDARIADAVKMVSLEGLEARRPNQLSGGQRQRVALARAIVCRPKVLLLDEPLSALDAKLRHQMQVELKELQGELGITFIFVTHDQEEALTMSDRIAVVNKGRIEQLGSVDEIYYQPRTKFVANFIGQANIIEAEVASRQGRLATVRLHGGLELMISADNLAPDSKSALVSVRPEKIHLEQKPLAGENTFPAFVKDEFFKGATDQLVIETESGLKLTAIVANEGVWDETFHKGDRIHCQIHPTDIVVVEEWNE